jgi:hypothetical protein
LEINRHFASIFMVRAKTLLVTCFHLGFYWIILRSSRWRRYVPSKMSV